jgi:two-component system, OmpR family, osmolarity sensor histidine kinase EnvZ
MKLLESFKPKTLFGRSALLIAGVVIVGQLLTAVVYYLAVQRPRVELLADFAINYVANMRNALDSIPKAERDGFIKANESLRELRLVRDLVPEKNQGQIPQLVVMLLTERLQQRLQNKDSLVLQVEPERALWVPLLTRDSEKYWVVIQLDRLRVDSLASLLIPSLIITVLSVLSALWIHRSINQPLLELQSAVRAVGSHERPRQITPQGPTEVVELTLAFNRMLNELTQVDADRSLMLAGVSHDLRTPITRVRLALELMQQNPSESLYKRMEANLNEVDMALTQFLDFARDERDEPVIEVDLRDIVGECTASYEAEERRIRLVVPDHAVLVQCRPQAIMRALRNLIDNSLKYSTCEIAIQVLQSTTTIGPVIKVSNEGEKLDDSELARLRLPFMRKLDSRSGAPGTGLGLAIVDRVAAMHSAKLLLAARDSGGLDASVVFNLLK